MTTNTDSILGSGNGDDNAPERDADKANPAIDRLREKAGCASEALRHGLEDLGELQDRCLDDCRACVREHPLSSVLIGVAAGLILARLLFR
jgi:ElaB/YqjD/DUF883 family membrane-anchored ribosome-binding protein